MSSPNSQQQQHQHHHHDHDHDALPLSSPPKRRMEDETSEELSSPTKRRRVLSPIEEEPEEDALGEDALGDSLYAQDVSSKHDGRDAVWKDSIPERLVVKSTPTLALLAAPVPALVPMAEQKSLEERLVESLSAVRSPELGSRRLMGNSTEEGPEEGVQDEKEKLMPVLTPSEQKLLGPGQNWKDAWFYNLFCEFKIFAQIVEMGGDVPGWENRETREGDEDGDEAGRRTDNAGLSDGDEGSGDENDQIHRT